MRAFII